MNDTNILYNSFIQKQMSRALLFIHIDGEKLQLPADSTYAGAIAAALCARNFLSLSKQPIRLGHTYIRLVRDRDNDVMCAISSNPDVSYFIVVIRNEITLLTVDQYNRSKPLPILSHSAISPPPCILRPVFCPTCQYYNSSSSQECCYCATELIIGPDDAQLNNYYKLY